MFWMVDDCDQGFAGEWGNPLDGFVQLQVGGVHLGVLLESVTKSLLLLLLQGIYQLRTDMIRRKRAGPCQGGSYTEWMDFFYLTFT